MTHNAGRIKARDDIHHKTAAGVGLNLTAANYVIFASLPWTPALKDQAEDRAYRNGQNRLVIVKIPLVEGTIDTALWELLEHKRAIATEVLNPEEAQAQSMLALAERLAA
jgi:SNF2 family DNA or RNA helicase